MRIARADRTRGAPVRGQVYRTLRESIESTALQPGQQLSENELSDLLGVSRSPIREALVRLRDERMVEIVPQLGTFVTRISRSALDDAQFVREALECSAIKAAAELASSDDVSALRAIADRQAQTRDADDSVRFYILDDEFHASLCVIGGHGVAWTISQRVSGHLNRIRHLSLPLPSYIADMVEQHLAVVTAIADHDPAAAEQALRHHLGMVLTGLPEVERQHPDYFESDSDRLWAGSLPTFK